MSSTALRNEPIVTPFDDIDRQIVKATQAGLPLSQRPYHVLARQLGLTASEVERRLRRMLDHGIIRRIGAVPNHYRLGYTANGMTVWDVPDERLAEMGPRIGALPFVTHCYHRPRFPPHWPYNLFAMVHGKDRGEVEAKAACIAQLLSDDNRGHAVLYSVRILKKNGIRLTG